MSKYKTIGNRIMQVLNSFPAMDELASEDVDIAFFAKMDLTGALLKAVAGIKEQPVIKIKGPRYFKSTINEVLWVVDADYVLCRQNETTGWIDVSDVWESADELNMAFDVQELTFPDFIQESKGNLPSTIPPF